MACANIFFENSTRTKFSFELALKRLGAHVLNFDSSSSSLSKGESLNDTLRTFEALGVEIAIIRHSDDNFIHSIKDKFKFRVINAGAGKYEHPSQSLLDLFTIQQEFGRLKDLTVSICGDIANSRVAKSNIAALSLLGAKVLLSGPQELLPDSKKLPKNCATTTLDQALPACDVAMFLRVQHERHQAFELPLTNYNETFGLNKKRVALLNPKSIIMHPGPVNRDVEIEAALVEHPSSRIFKQMENGVYTRMAILDWIMESE